MVETWLQNKAITFEVSAAQDVVQVQLDLTMLCRIWIGEIMFGR